ncbi:MAG: helix-turn-helix domain-containing protein [Solirubrobacteraceae bacterium]
MSRPIEIEPLRWIARIGGATAEDLARALSLPSQRTAQRHLRALEDAGLARRAQLLYAQPALWLATAAGLRLAGQSSLGVSSVSASGFAHMLECGRVAATLEQGLSAGITLCGERELRAWERAAARPLASAEVGFGPDGSVALHRPDLVAWNAIGAAVAVEVELTRKASQRLRAIVRGWARSRCVDGVLYLCTADTGRAVTCAIESERAQSHVEVLALEAWTAAQVESMFAPRSHSSVPNPA